MKVEDYYYLPLFKSGERYFRVGRNSPLRVRIPAELLRHHDVVSSYLLVGDYSLSRFVILTFTQKPYYKVAGVYVVNGYVDSRINQLLRQKKVSAELYATPLLSPRQSSALASFMSGRGTGLFS